MKKLHTRFLVGFTALLAALSLPSFSQEPAPEEPEEPPPDIVTVVPFSRKSRGGDGCENPGGGCVITVFSDGSVTATNVD